MSAKGHPLAEGPAEEFLFGRNVLWEALEAGVQVDKVYLARGVHPQGLLAKALELAQRRGIPLEMVEREVLDRASGHHQGVMAQVAPFRYSLLEEVLSQGGEPLLLVLDCLQDVQNFGSLLRTAEAVGVAGVVIPSRRMAPVNAAVRRSSAGAVEHLRVVQVANLARTLEVLKERGFWVVGLENLPRAQDYHTFDWQGKVALVVGSEGQGMRRLVREACDILVKIPTVGRVKSLNAAIAGSIVLYHAWRARQEAGPLPPPTAGRS